MENLRQLLKLYVITDQELSQRRSNFEVVEKAVLGGATIIQYREKQGLTSKLYEEALSLRSLTFAKGVPLIINDRLDLALAVDADGVHLGQDDLPPAVARNVLGSGKILGVSVGCVEEALKAEAEGADYLGVGPIFTTATKEDAGVGIGVEVLKAVREAVSLPLVAIGGINLVNATTVLKAGADGLAVISAVVAAELVEEAATELKTIIERELKK